jgi:hypothetical protein
MLSSLKQGNRPVVKRSKCWSGISVRRGILLRRDPSRGLFRPGSKRTNLGAQELCQIR